MIISLSRLHLHYKPRDAEQIVFEIKIRNALHLGLWWGTLIVLTFKVRYFELYLPKTDAIYGDLKSIMACSDFIIPGFGTDCSDWLYGRFLKYILTEASFLDAYTDELIMIFLCLFLLSLASIIRDFKDIKLQIFGLLIFLSPPIALLVQRANVDIVIFFLSWLALKLHKRGNLILGLAVSAFAATLKMYPFALFLILLMDTFIKKRSFIYRFNLVVFGVLLMISTLVDIKNIPWIPSDGRTSFGLRIFGEYLVYFFYGSGKQMLPILGIVTGLVILFAFIIFTNVLKLKVYEVKEFLFSDIRIWIAYFLLIFFSGISTDYRLIYVLPAIKITKVFSKNGKLYVILLFSLSFYLSYPLENFQVLGDVFLFLLIALFIRIFYNTRFKIGQFHSKY
jgi:hypothetical protein